MSCSDHQERHAAEAEPGARRRGDGVRAVRLHPPGNEHGDLPLAVAEGPVGAKAHIGVDDAGQAGELGRDAPAGRGSRSGPARPQVDDAEIGASLRAIRLESSSAETRIAAS